MTHIGKVAIVATALSAVGGGTAYATGLFNNPKPKKTILNITNTRLVNEGFEVLDTGKDKQDQEWQAVLNGYIKATKGTFIGGVDKSRSKEDLKKECEKQLKLGTNESYLLARQWCVKETTVGAVLKKEYTILTTSQEKTDEKEYWAKKVSKLKATQGDKFKNLREKLKNPATDATTLREECGKLKPDETKTTSETFSDVFEQIRDYCSVKKKDGN